MDLKASGQYIHRDNISEIERFLLYVLDQASTQKITENDKRTLAVAYHRLWWYRDQEIKRYFPKTEKFEEYTPFIFPEHKLTAEQDLKKLLLNSKDYSKLFKLFKTDISKILDFFAVKGNKEVETEAASILYYDTHGNFWHGDKTKFCYPIGSKSGRFLILKYLIENKGYQMTAEISDALGNKDKQGIRTEIRKIKSNIQKYLGLDDVLLSKMHSGYGINPKYKIVLYK